MKIDSQQNSLVHRR